MAKSNGPREKSERDLLDEIKRLLILQITKGKATQEEVGKTLGVSKAQVNNLLMGADKNNRKEKHE